VPNAHIPGLNLFFALRHRFAEDELAKAVTRRTTQYVILGAGLDSFAYRRPDLVRSLDVYEVDHPASQAWKRERVAALGIPIPPTLHYAPIDFERTSLTEGLVTAGLKRHEPTFFTWLGVTQYLTRETVLRTLREVAALSTVESTLVLEFLAPPRTVNGEDAALFNASAEAVARLGEPWLSFFTPDDMSDALTQAGFRSVEHFGPAEAFDGYLRGRSDGPVFTTTIGWRGRPRDRRSAAIECRARKPPTSWLDRAPAPRSGILNHPGERDAVSCIPPCGSSMDAQGSGQRASQ
jgi:methyltransferase (TIGR00027 family)